MVLLSSPCESSPESRRHWSKTSLIDRRAKKSPFPAKLNEEQPYLGQHSFANEGEYLLFSPSSMKSSNTSRTTIPNTCRFRGAQTTDVSIRHKALPITQAIVRRNKWRTNPPTCSNSGPRSCSKRVENLTQYADQSATQHRRLLQPERLIALSLLSAHCFYEWGSE